MYRLYNWRACIYGFLLCFYLFACVETVVDQELDEPDFIAGEVMAGEVMAGEVMADEVMAGEVMAGEVMAGEIMAGEIMAGEVMAGEMSLLPEGQCEQMRVNAELGLRLRPQANTNQMQLALLPLGTLVTILEIVEGEVINGDSRWARVDAQGLSGYLSMYFLDCVDVSETIDDEVFFTPPLVCDTRAIISQSFNDTQGSHSGRSRYALDFALGSGTEITAMAPGRVLKTYLVTEPGDPCYNGGERECRDAANYIILEHSDQTRTAYLHLNEIHVNEGEQVTRAQVIGLSGHTGWSTGPHLHVERQEPCGDPRNCQTIHFSLLEIGVPAEDQWVNALPCP